MLKNILILIISLFATIGMSQNVIATSYPVLFNGKNLKTPFVGGLNVPQIYTIHLNDDGLLDVVILDREGAVILPYLRTEGGTGTNLEYAPSYKSSFPNVQEWFKIRDFNNDGIDDLFCYPTSNAPGIEARKGKYENGKIVFEQ